MKKLITILAIILLASCTGFPVRDKDIVIGIKVTNDIPNSSLYTASCDKCYEHEFIAPTGLYNIGDTIHFVKR